MNARRIFIDERQLNATNNQFALASGICTPDFPDDYISVRGLLSLLQDRCDATANVLVQAQYQNNDEQKIDTIYVSAKWEALNEVIQNLKNGVL